MMFKWRLWLLVMACMCGAELAADELADLDKAREFYRAQDYASAIDVLNKTLANKPECLSSYECAEIYHWLGRAYGREAEQANWFKAPGLAKKARVNFEKTVELDPDSQSAWKDLFKYYIRAPKFLGGGKDKAEFAAGRLNLLDEALGRQAQAILKGDATDFTAIDHH